MPVGGSMARTSTRTSSPTRLEPTAWPAGPGRGAGGRRQGLAKQQANAPSNISDLAPLVWRVPEGPEGTAAVPVGGGRAREHRHLKPRPIGGHRVACGARPRCRWAAAWPEQAHAPPSPTRLEATAWPAGPGRGAGGRRQGQGGPRDRPLRAAGSRVAISRAGRRPPAHTAARPFKAGHTVPGTPVGPQATPEIRRVRKRHRHNGRKETPTAPGTP